ncbi:alpha/beta hydrolase [Gordonia sp. NPDC058843]|uniref:alpha/beta hydrolase n=1 Tax=Gordonia sp. NPDC058843 TaxID=3346648 RepID=UPI00368F1E20
MTTTPAHVLVVPARAPQRTRGEVHVLIGRGDTPAVYQRFADRLAADGYAVHVRPDAVTTAVRADGDVPQIVIGIDAGAIRAADIARVDPSAIDAVVLVGLPGPDDPDSSALTAELEIEARASCPTQQGRLRDSAIITAGQLIADLPPSVASGTIDVPVLALHGEDDRVSPLDTADGRYRQLGIDHLTVVESGRHDVLNSVHHRTVAASIVSFLEQVRHDGRAPLAQRSLSAEAIR